MSRPNAAPLTWGQAQHWYPYLSLPEGERWREHLLVDVPLPGGLPLDILRGRLRNLVARHEALRTRYEHGDDGRPRQIVCPPAEPVVAICDVTGEADPRAVAQAFAARLCRRDLDLTAAPPVRIGAVRSDGQVHWVFLAMHHVAGDGVGLDLVRAELSASEPPRTQPAQPRAEAEFEASEPGRALRHRALKYWQDLAATFPRTTLPVPHRLAVPRRAAEARLHAPVAAALREVSRRHGVAETTVLLGGWLLLLRHYTGNLRTATRVTAANRSRRHMMSIVGSFSQTLPVVVDVPVQGGLGELLDAARAAELLGFRYGRFDPEPVSEVIATARTSRGASLDTIPSFNYVTSILPAADPDGAGYSWAEVDSSPTSPLQLRIRMYGSVVRLVLRYDVTLLSPAEAEALVRALERLLACAGSDPGIDVGELARRAELPAAERGAGWARVEGSWVCAAATAELLTRHPAVLTAEAEPADDSVTARVVLCAPVTERELRCQVAPLLPEHPGAALPDRLVVTSPTDDPYDLPESQVSP